MRRGTGTVLDGVGWGCRAPSGGTEGGARRRRGCGGCASETA